MAGTELRQLSIGELLDKTLSLYRGYFLLFLGIATVPALAHFAYEAFGILLALMPARPPGAAGIILLALGGGLLFILVYGFAYGLGLAATVFAVSEVNLGRETTIRKSFARARPLAMRAFWIFLLLGLAAGVGLVLLIVPGVLVAVTYAVAIPAAVMENLKAGPSFRRSEFLTKGRRGSIFLVFLLFVVLSYIAAFTFALPAGLLQAWRPGLVSALLVSLSGFLTETLTGPLLTIGLSLLYYDLRIRKEGFDLQVMLASLDQSTPPGASALEP
jgi:hypothetical protein